MQLSPHEASDLLGASVILQLAPASLLMSQPLVGTQVRGLLLAVDPVSGTAVVDSDGELRIVFGHAIESIENDSLDSRNPLSRSEIAERLNLVNK
ncbi:hypothetical protein BDR26DRAFT_1010212 [Obelidium mucronatum]|nr:hypothetical protein BDR26DRAFT_1010212 [Obelidium mucronatum]